MTQGEQNSAATPLFSIVIPVYNDWRPLEGCLQSIARQANAPSLEVIIVDDGSKETAPDSIRGALPGHTLTVIRQAHLGIPSARNRGIKASGGAVLLCVDADSRLEADCLAALNSTISQLPQYDCFQLQLVGNRSSLVGRAEALRLMTLQQHMVRSDGCIRYLNTAGFAIRRGRADLEAGVFDPLALRAEDTLLLANLIQVGELPLFVPHAIVEHAIPLSLLGCFRKDIRSAYLERRAYEIIASKGVRIRLANRERLRLLFSMWRTAGQDSIGRSAWFALVARQVFLRTISLGYRCLRFGFSANALGELHTH